MIGGGEHPGTECGCGHSLKRDHASVSPMRWPRNIPWTTLPSGLAKHHWRVGLGPRTHGDSVSWHQVSGRCLVRQLSRNRPSDKPGTIHHLKRATMEHRTAREFPCLGGHIIGSHGAPHPFRRPQGAGRTTDRRPGAPDRAAQCRVRQPDRADKTGVRVDAMSSRQRLRRASIRFERARPGWIIWCRGLLGTSSRSLLA